MYTVRPNYLHRLKALALGNPGTAPSNTYPQHVNDAAQDFVAALKSYDPVGPPAEVYCNATGYFLDIDAMPATFAEMAEVERAAIINMMSMQALFLAAPYLATGSEIPPMGYQNDVAKPLMSALSLQSMSSGLAFVQATMGFTGVFGTECTAYAIPRPSGTWFHKIWTPGQPFSLPAGATALFVDHTLEGLENGATFSEDSIPHTLNGDHALLIRTKSYGAGDSQSYSLQFQFTALTSL